MLRRVTIKRFDFFIYFGILVYTVFFLFTLQYRGKSPFVFATFFLVGAWAFYEIIASKENISIYRTAFIFIYIFFFMAPLQQYTTGITLWKGNGLSVQFNDASYLKANLIVLLMIAVYKFTYDYTIVKEEEKERVIQAEEDTYLSQRTKRFLLVASTFSIVFLFATGNLTGVGMNFVNTAITSQLLNIIRYIPVCAVILYGIGYKHLKSAIKQKSFIVVMTYVAIIFFPFWGHLARFITFGTYIVILSLFYSRGKNKSLYFLLFFIGFSLSFTGFRHATSFTDIISLAPNYNHADFDAYQMLMTIVHYTDENGIVYGLNILSALLFLLPRSIWHGKLENTGAIAVFAYGSWFGNVSAPIAAEFYYAFSWIGVIIGGCLLGIMTKRIDSWSLSTKLLKRGTYCIFTGMTMYILRGSLLATMAFTLGLILILYVMSLLAKANRLNLTINDRERLYS